MGVDNRSRAQRREAYERAMNELGFVRRQERRLAARLARVRGYVDDPANCSVSDGRRAVLLDLIDADEHDPATNPACAFASAIESFRPERGDS